MKKIFFISDVHLGLQDKEHEKEKEKRLLTFLSHVEDQAEQLFILGDLFDYWFEYKYVIPRGYHHTLSKLATLVEKGIKVHYVAGNHDFWLKDFFPVDLGIPVYKDPFAMTIAGKKFFFHHGDGLALKDGGYRFLKKILRNKINIAFFTLVHPDLTAPIARGSSRKSREFTANKEYGETDGMILFATEKIRNGYDVVVMGHRHSPLYQKIDKGVYVNLGDWITHMTYAEFDGKNIELKTWHSR
ncbi:MAG TPA: UDP-2,3-diacylglucosamine diphosphatase [Bacteroidota bacterium]|nr:UDP-2,3-diacylglucosamine diphosphatase [Bacteroidota bacterium]